MPPAARSQGQHHPPTLAHTLARPITARAPPRPAPPRPVPAEHDPQRRVQADGHEQHPERDPGQRGPPGNRARGCAGDRWVGAGAGAGRGRCHSCCCTNWRVGWRAARSSGSGTGSIYQVPATSQSCLQQSCPVPPWPLLHPCLLPPSRTATAGSARMFNWLDFDGSSTQRTGPSIIGSFPSWWQLAPDCSYEVRGGRAGGRGRGLGAGGWGLGT